MSNKYRVINTINVRRYLQTDFVIGRGQLAVCLVNTKNTL